MPLSDIDRKLIDRCLGREPGAWNDFVDRYLGLIYHVIQHVAHARSRAVSQADMEDIAAEILLRIVDDDYDILRRYKGISSLPTYLTVIARRICVKEMVKRQREAELGHASAHRENVSDASGEVEAIATAEEVDRMLEELPEREAEVVRLYHLKFMNYREIGKRLGIPEARSGRSSPRPGNGCGIPPNTGPRRESGQRHSSPRSSLQRADRVGHQSRAAAVGRRTWRRWHGGVNHVEVEDGQEHRTLGTDLVLPSRRVHGRVVAADLQGGIEANAAPRLWDGNCLADSRRACRVLLPGHFGQVHRGVAGRRSARRTGRPLAGVELVDLHVLQNDVERELLPLPLEHDVLGQRAG